MTMPCSGHRMERRVVGRLELPGGERAFVATTLVYEPSDCMAVTMTFRRPDGLIVDWKFAWDLLRQGLVYPSGAGDVRVSPAAGLSGLTQITLAGTFNARIVYPAHYLESFVRLVRAVAARDRWRITASLDAQLAAIASEGQR